VNLSGDSQENLGPPIQTSVSPFIRMYPLADVASSIAVSLAAHRPL
jgi:hypothetical protein